MAAAGPNKKLCGAKTKTGTCRNVAGKGTDHLHVGRCSRHLGSTQNHKTAAEREQARQACALFTLDVGQRSPAEVLLDEILRARTAMAWYEQEIAFAMATGDDELAEARRKGWRIERGIAERVAVEVLRLGIEQRHVQFMEDQARDLFARFTLFIRMVGLDPESLEVRKAARVALTSDQAALTVVAGEAA